MDHTKKACLVGTSESLGMTHSTVRLSTGRSESVDPVESLSSQVISVSGSQTWEPIDEEVPRRQDLERNLSTLPTSLEFLKGKK